MQAKKKNFNYPSPFIRSKAETFLGFSGIFRVKKLWGSNGTERVQVHVAFSDV